MRRLVINDYGVFLGRKGDRLVVKKGGEKVGEVAAGNLTQVVVASRGVSISSAALRLLLKYKVDFVVLGGAGYPMGRLVSWRGRGVKLRRLQYSAQSSLKGVHLARRFAEAKILNQRALLRSYAKNRRGSKPALAKKLLGLAEAIGGVRAKLLEVDGPSLEEVRPSIMAREAEAAEHYWAGVGALLSDASIEFPGRRKRFDNPADPVNLSLNYCYGLLASEVWFSLESSPLDPYVGFLHADSPRRPALAMDLMEEFRQPVVDRAVLALLLEKRKSPEGALEGGRISPEWRRTLIKAFRERLSAKVTFMNRCLPIEAHILLQARRIAEFIADRAGEYAPYAER